MRGIVALVLLAFYAGAATVIAQHPAGFAPPSHGALTGWTNYETRSMRVHHLTFKVNVPIFDLQAALPTGYIAMRSDDDANVAELIVVIGYQARVEVPAAFNGIAVGNYGPSSFLSVEAIAKEGLSLNEERLILLHERSTQDSVDFTNKAFGVGSARLADSVRIDINEEAGVLRFKFRVRDNSLNLDFTGEANVESDIVARLKQDLLPTPFRYVNGDTVNSLFQVGVQGDDITVTASTDTLRLQLPGGKLRLPNGELKVLSPGALVTLFRNLEVFTR